MNNDAIELNLTPKKLIHSNGDFKIYACETDDPNVQLNKYNNCSIKGVMPRLDLGVEYKAVIELADVSKEFGASYKCISIYQDIPETAEGQKEYLATILTKIQLEEIYKVYSEEDDIIELIRSREFDYKKVKGIGEVVFERIFQKINETLEYKDILSKFGKYGITYETILTLAKEMNCSRQVASSMLEENPYLLCEYVSGWGFVSADKLAQKMGIPIDSPYRIETGIKYQIEMNQNQGHTYINKSDLIFNSSNLLGVDEALIANVLDVAKGIKIIDDNKVTLFNTYKAEYNIAKTLQKMLKNNIELDFDTEDFLRRAEHKNNISLTDQQKDFFTMFKKYRVGLLVGFAGSGKSSIIKLLIDLLKELKMTYTILSPSAQAAKVSTKYTGVKATTIHRKIGWGRGKNDRSHLYEINEDVIITDEAGMEDVFIGSMKSSKITNPKARILFVGDPFQLPSVSAGNILHDMIESNVIPMTKLDIIFRQKEGGLIDIATKIRQKEKFVPNDFVGSKLYGKDFFLKCLPQSKMEEAYKDYYNIFLKTFKPNDIMVLSPTKKGPLGTIQINKYIQSIINPPSDEKKQHPYGDEVIFRTDDYVINTQNMYDIADYEDMGAEIVNGDKGVLYDFVKGAQEKLEADKYKYSEDEYRELKEKEINKNGIVIDFADVGKVRLDFNQVDQLLHAWCITIHKSQGDAAPAVLIVADRSHKHQLSANLLYTAITRSKERGILLTQADTLNYAINKVENFRRKTFLQDLLKRDLISETQEDPDINS